MYKAGPGLNQGDGVVDGNDVDFDDASLWYYEVLRKTHGGTWKKTGHIIMIIMTKESFIW